MKETWALDEAKRLSEIVKNSKVLTKKDMVWFDVLYGIDNEWNEKFNKYRSGECTIEEALISGLLYFAKQVHGLDYKKLMETIDKTSN